MASLAPSWAQWVCPLLAGLIWRWMFFSQAHTPLTCLSPITERRAVTKNTVVHASVLTLAMHLSHFSMSMCVCVCACECGGEGGEVWECFTQRWTFLYWGVFLCIPLSFSVLIFTWHRSHPWPLTSGFSSKRNTLKFLNYIFTSPPGKQWLC